jgi:hypothetical protein
MEILHYLFMPDRIEAAPWGMIFARPPPFFRAPAQYFSSLPLFKDGHIWGIFPRMRLFRSRVERLNYVRTFHDDFYRRAIRNV